MNSTPSIRLLLQQALETSAPKVIDGEAVETVLADAPHTET